ncbi:MAG TPA: tetratricopeptide repeat protein, partial [Roseiarcus sp.]|nr:tetratricopeptide repeat protein [Roseiarcus sp.]
MFAGGDQQKLQTGYLLHQRGAVVEAAKLYRELIEKDARNYHALHFLGLIEAGAGHFDKAKPLMARSLAIRPPNVQFIENYAALLVQLGDHAEALLTCGDGLKVKRDSLSLLYMSAASLLKLGKLPESLAQFDEVLKIQPNHVAALNERSVALAGLNKDDLA